MVAYQDSGPGEEEDVGRTYGNHDNLCALRSWKIRNDRTGESSSELPLDGL